VLALLSSLGHALFVLDLLIFNQFADLAIVKVKHRWVFHLLTDHYLLPIEKLLLLLELSNYVLNLIIAMEFVL
jgi:hypothetical protein